MSSAHAISAPRAPGLVSFLNPLIRRLLGTGMPFGPNVLLTVRGRASGQPRTFPVAILEHQGRRFVQSPFGEVNWVRNLRVSGEATITRGRHSEGVDAAELRPEEAGPILQAALAPYAASRVGRAVMGRLFEVRADSTSEDYVAEARRHPMFELRSKA